jgi:hypothetical protein
VNKFNNLPINYCLFITLFYIHSFSNISFEATYANGMLFIDKFVIFLKEFIIVAAIFSYF